jgi:hypothetical protein
MKTLACLSMFAALSGCSIALHPAAKGPRITLVAVDSAAAVAAGVLGGIELNAQCSSEQFICLSSIDHTIGAIAITTAAVFALSALVGATRHEAEPAPAPSAAAHVALDATAHGSGTISLVQPSPRNL